MTSDQPSSEDFGRNERPRFGAMQIFMSDHLFLQIFVDRITGTAKQQPPTRLPQLMLIKAIERKVSNLAHNSKTPNWTVYFCFAASTELVVEMEYAPGPCGLRGSVNAVNHQ